MTTHLSGAGWVTPLGVGLDGVWDHLLRGESGDVKTLSSPSSPRKHSYFPVPPELVQAVGRNPRLRRSSVISAVTATAGLAALDDAGITMTPEVASRLALVFAISSGGVIYTRRFYDTIVTQGAAVASPLLFPETVYNAPASHLAALLGITGMSYTLVGDSSVGIAALQYAEQLLETDDQLDHCLVIGGEEVDWVLCEAYREWRLISDEPPMQIYAERPSGTVLGEGGAAVVLGRQGPITVDQIHAGVPFFKGADAPAAAEKVFRELLEEQGQVDLIIGSANGTFIDQAEAHAIRTHLAETEVYCPKPALGDALGAGSLIQTICGALALRRGEIPPVAQQTGSPGDVRVVRERATGRSIRSALISAVGFNQQASGLLLKTSA